MNTRKIWINLELWWSNWKRLHKKPYRDCDLDELFKKREFHKHMSWSYLVEIIIILGMIVELYLREKGDIVLNMIIILVMIALYDSKNEINYIDSYIYYKEKDNHV